jgi:hypothetical protein
MGWAGMDRIKIDDDKGNHGAGVGFSPLFKDRMPSSEIPKFRRLTQPPYKPISEFGFI